MTCGPRGAKGHLGCGALALHHACCLARLRGACPGFLPPGCSVPLPWLISSCRVGCLDAPLPLPYVCCFVCWKGDCSGFPTTRLFGYLWPVHFCGCMVVSVCTVHMLLGCCVHPRRGRPCVRLPSNNCWCVWADCWEPDATSSPCRRVVSPHFVPGWYALAGGCSGCDVSVCCGHYRFISGPVCR